MNNNILNKKFRYTYSNSVAWLVGVNVLIYFIITIANPVIGRIPLYYWLSLIPVFIRQGYIWQFVTYMFVHVDTMHLFFNMYALFMFGMTLERSIGTREFLLFYFVTGVLGGVLSYVIYLFAGMNVALMGASGAVYALLFLTSVMYPHGRILLFFFIPMKMPVAVMVFMAIEVFSQVFGSNTGVAHLVHLSGIAIAWVYCLLRFRISPIKVWRDALR